MHNACNWSVSPLFCRRLVGVDRATPTRLKPLLHLTFKGAYVRKVGVSALVSYFFKKKGEIGKRDIEGTALPTPTRRLFITENRCKPRDYWVTDESVYILRRRLDADHIAPTPTTGWPRVSDLTSATGGTTRVTNEDE